MLYQLIEAGTPKLLDAGLVIQDVVERFPCTRKCAGADGLFESGIALGEEDGDTIREHIKAGLKLGSSDRAVILDNGVSKPFAGVYRR